jgi:lactam utilization protein B
MSISASRFRRISRSRIEPDKEMVSMVTTAEHTRIVTLLAAGKPVWYVAAVTKAHTHDVYAVGASYGYPDRNRLRQALRTTHTPDAA